MEDRIKELEERVTDLEDGAVDTMDAQNILAEVVFGRREWLLPAIMGASIVLGIWGVVAMVSAWTG